MWPLDKGENRHGQNLEEHAPAEVEKPKLTFKSLGEAAKSKDKKKAEELYIIIKSTR